MLGASQPRVPLDAGGQRRGDPASVDDGQLGIAIGVTLDPVSGVPHHFVDGRTDRRERTERAVAEPITGAASGKHVLDEFGLEQALIRPRDTDSHGLGLVLDGIDRTGEFLDGGRQSMRQILDDHAGRPNLAHLHLVALERDHAGGEAQQHRQTRSGRGLEMTVVGAGAQQLEEAGRTRLDVAPE